MQNLSAPIINLDQPLTVGSALENDKLNRREFAENAARILTRPDESGFAISIEGSWGSGKSSMLAMIEQLVSQPNHASFDPIVVHFNPWLIGEREALLQEFLREISLAIGNFDKSKRAKKVITSIMEYAEIASAIVPGAAPLKAIVGLIKKATKEDKKHPHVELSEQRSKVKESLDSFQRVIIVFIDDIDRLPPQEVFEMIRVIKAVGDLPNIRYVCAWDPIYISRALENASIPHADTYLDKIIQARLPLPTLSDEDKRALFDEACQRLGKEALREHFQGGGYRLEDFYFYALRPILAHPRDINRIINIASTIEPNLRGEIVLSDIIGLAAIMAKAPPVFDLLKRHPEWFAGLPDNYPIIKENLNLLIQEAQQYLESAYKDCESPTSIENLINYLFPLTRKREILFFSKEIEEMKGHLAAPQRLTIALQHKVRHSDISLVKVKEFLVSANSREGIAKSLTKENCAEFIDSIGAKIAFIDPTKITDLEQLCLAISRLIEHEIFRKTETDFINGPVEMRTETTISYLIDIVDPKAHSRILRMLIEDESSISLPRYILKRSYSEKVRTQSTYLTAKLEKKEEFISIFNKKILKLARENKLLETLGAKQTLWHLPSISKDTCPEIFSIINRSPVKLDKFITLMLIEKNNKTGHYYDGTGGTTHIRAYCPIKYLKDYAKTLLANKNLKYPSRAAWRAFLEEKAFYSQTGLEVKNEVLQEELDRSLPTED